MVWLCGVLCWHCNVGYGYCEYKLCRGAVVKGNV